MLDLYLRVALLSTLSLYVSSLSLKRELESVDTKSLDELASGNEDHLLSLKIRKRADDNNSNQQKWQKCEEKGIWRETRRAGGRVPCEESA